MPQANNKESEVRVLLQRLQTAWKEKKFEGLNDCFHPAATIVGPKYKVFASGGQACAESYREFANNAAVLEYSEDDHQLRVWDTTAVYTFSWRITYQRDAGPSTEVGTDQLVLSLFDGDWKVVFRYIEFAPAVG